MNKEFFMNSKFIFLYIDIGHWKGCNIAFKIKSLILVNTATARTIIVLCGIKVDTQPPRGHSCFLWFTGMHLEQPDPQYGWPGPAGIPHGMQGWHRRNPGNALDRTRVWTSSILRHQIQLPWGEAQIRVPVSSLAGTFDTLSQVSVR